MIPGHELESIFLLNNLKPRRDPLLGAVAQWQLRLCFLFFFSTKRVCSLEFNYENVWCRTIYILKEISIFEKYHNKKNSRLLLLSNFAASFDQYHRCMLLKSGRETLRVLIHTKHCKISVLVFLLFFFFYENFKKLMSFEVMMIRKGPQKQNSWWMKDYAYFFNVSKRSPFIFFYFAKKWMFKNFQRPHLYVFRHYATCWRPKKIEKNSEYFFNFFLTRVL